MQPFSGQARRRHFSKAVLDKPLLQVEGASQLEDVRHAMKDLTELVQPDGQPRPMSWAMRWLADVGIRQDNPATLMMFVLRWPSHFATVLEALREFKPVA